MRVQARHLAVLVAVLLVSCARVPPQLEPEGIVAMRGGEIIRAMEAALDVANALNQAGQLDDLRLRAVAQASLRVGEEAERLSLVLFAVDNARNATDELTGLARAQQIVFTLYEILGSLGSLPDDVAVNIETAYRYTEGIGEDIRDRVIRIEEAEEEVTP